MITQVHRLPGLVLSDMEFSVPLDHAHSEAERITVFARAVVAPGQEDANLPWLVFFQGGPGAPAPRPEGNGGWLGRALQEYRVLLLDGRGTGLSSPVTAQTLAHLPSAQAQAEYLSHFRADSIVQDAELIRRELIGDEGRWSVLGQSFGGFCVTHYLSAAPQGLREALITGGLPPLDRPVDDIYKATYATVLQKNRQYYARYPEDEPLAREIVAYLGTQRVQLPAGGPLSPRRFQQLGGAFGASTGFAQVHYLLEKAFVTGATGRELNYVFLRDFEQTFSFDTGPIYALLHEAEYCQGQASKWSAERVRVEYPQFELKPDQTVMFTGEVVYPWMFEEYEQLRPLREAANILAEYQDWPRLYDVAALQANRVPCAAAMYYNDMYVSRIYSEETAATIGGLKVWVTNEYEHNGLRADGEHILGRLLDMLRGKT
jgi:pimeloyl-ACP methyl ester carboxylesterase